MKKLLIVTLSLLSFVSFARPILNGDMPVNPALKVMNLVMPIAGTDYPTETSTKIKSILALSNNIRIKIYDDTPKLVTAQAGIDFPTEVTNPLWTKFQKVLVFNNAQRAAVRLALNGEKLMWNLKSGQQIYISDIKSIKKEKAGLDYPTDTNHNPIFFIELLNGSHIDL
jgi:hypothetical protein